MVKVNLFLQKKRSFFRYLLGKEKIQKPPRRATPAGRKKTALMSPGISKEELAKWVQYAKEHSSIILFDAAYEAFITEEDVPHSIYEIEGAKEVAIEFRSFSKTAGFTGLRCAYMVVPKELVGYTENDFSFLILGNFMIIS